MNKTLIRTPLVVADFEMDTEIELVSVAFNGNYGPGAITIPSNIGLKSKRFRVAIEALDVTQALEE